jgi:hypothetical protein
MSGLAIVSGIALSMGQPASSLVIADVPSSQIAFSNSLPFVTGHAAQAAPVQVAGLSDWLLQLFTPKKHEIYREVVIDRPYRF